MKDREKEIKYLIYLKSEIIRETKKEIRKLNRELKEYEGEKKLNRRKENK